MGWFPAWPPVTWCGFGFSCCGPPCIFGSALGVWYTHRYMMNMIMMMMITMMGTVITIITIHSFKHLNVSLVGRRASSAHVPGNEYRFIDRRATTFVTVVALGAIAIRLQWANCHRDRACQGTQSSPRDSCRAYSLGSVHSHKDRACLGLDPRDSRRLWRPHV